MLVLRGCRVCLILSMLCCALSALSVRVRLPTGKTARLRIASESTLSALHQTLLHAGFYANNETDVVHIAGRVFSGKVLSALRETVGSVGLTAGDIIQVTAASSNSVTGKGTTTRTDRRPTQHTQATLLSCKRRNARSRGSLIAIMARRAAMLRVKHQPAAKNITAYVDVARIGSVLSGMIASKANTDTHIAPSQRSRATVALLLGNSTVFGNGTSSSWCTAAVEVVDTSTSSSDISDRDLTSVSRYIIQQTTWLAGLLGLEVVGCAVSVRPVPVGEPAVAASGRGTGGGVSVPKRRAVPPSSSASKHGWTADHVRRALQMQALSAAAAVPVERFVVLSVQSKITATGDGGGAQESSAQLDAYALSSLALELHNRSQILPPGPNSAPNIVQLKEPVILSDGREATEVDALLLAAPLPLVELAATEGHGASAQLADTPFPSLLLMQRDIEAAGCAQGYLRRLLDALLEDQRTGDKDSRGGGVRRSVRQDLLRRLADPQLLLYLALLLGDGPASDAGHGIHGPFSPLAALCGELRPYLRSRSPSTMARVKVSAQTLGALEAARNALANT